MNGRRNHSLQGRLGRYLLQAMAIAAFFVFQAVPALAFTMPPGYFPEVLAPIQGEAIYGSYDLKAQFLFDPTEPQFIITPVAGGQPLHLTGQMISENPWILSRTWDSTGLSDGDYEIVAEGKDASGATLTSDPVPFSIQNGQQQAGIQVTVTQPYMQETVAGEYQFMAQTDQFANSLSFHVSPLDQSSGPHVLPASSFDNTVWTATWNTTQVSNGDHIVYAQANGDATTNSENVYFLIANEDQQPPEEITVNLYRPTGNETVAGISDLIAVSSSPVDSMVFLIFNDSGSMVKQYQGATQDNLYWEYGWLSNELPNGSYTVQARANGNPNLASQTVSITIQNAGEEPPDQEPSPPIVQMVQPTPNQQVTGSFVFRAQTDQAVDGLKFNIAGADVQNSQVAFELVAGSDQQKMAWQATWNSAARPNGTYTVNASASSAAADVQSAPVSFTVYNASQTPWTTTLVAPLPEASLLGQVELRASTSLAADELVFLIQNAADAQQPPISLTAQADQAGTLWTASWNAGSVPPGQYTITAKAKRGQVERISSGVAVNVEQTTINVQLLSPQQNQELQGQVNLSAAAIPEASSLSFHISNEQIVREAPAVYDQNTQSWRTNWNSANVPDGPYRLYAEAKNQSGVAFRSVTIDVGVSNLAEEPAQLSVDLIRPQDGEVFTGEAYFLSVVSGGSAIGLRFVIHPLDIEGPDIIVGGQAGQAAEAQRWEAVRTLSVGKYQVSAEAWAAGGSEQQPTAVSGTVQFEVRTAPPDEEQPPPEGAEPLTIKITAPAAGSEAAGRISLTARTNVKADSAEFILRPEADPQAVPVRLTAGQAEGGLAWSSQWDTNFATPGTYILVAQARRANQAATSDAVTIRVGEPVPEPPPATVKIGVVEPTPGSVVQGVTLVRAQSNIRPVRVIFLVRAADTGQNVATLKGVFEAKTRLWTAFWDATDRSAGQYELLAVAELTDNRQAESDPVPVEIIPLSAPRKPGELKVIPPEIVRIAIDEVPEGLTELETSDLPEVKEDARQRLQEECRAAGVPAERCDQWLAARNRGGECRQAGIITKQGCISYLRLRYDDQLPGCEGRALEECTDIIEKMTAGLLDKSDLARLNLLLSRDIGKTVRLRGKLTEEAAAEEGRLPLRRLPTIDEELEPVVALDTDHDIGLKFHASRSFVKLTEDKAVRTLTAVLTLDSDGDGLPDDTERRLGTDPDNPDTDGDSYDDRTEIEGGYNPLGTGRMGETSLSPVDEALISGAPLEQPIVSGEVSGDLTVERTEIVRQEEVSRMRFGGRGVAGETVSIFIYSYLPVVLTTTVGDDGTWSYELDGSLDEGEHEVYVTVTDQTGRIAKKSSPLSFFVAEAQAVTSEDFFGAEAAEAISFGEFPEFAEIPETAGIQPTSRLMRQYIIGAAILIVLALVITGLIVVRPWKRKEEGF